MREIGKWEFTREGAQRLSYRLSVKGMIPGIVALLVAMLFFGFCSYHMYLKAKTAPGEIGWAIGFLIAAILCIVGLPFHLRLRAQPCVMDRRLDHFRLGEKVVCALSDVRQIHVERIVGPSGGDSHRPVTYHVQLVLHSGAEQFTYLVATTSNRAEEYAEQLRDFLNVPVR